MMIDATELMPGKTYVIKTPCSTLYDLTEYAKELEAYVPKYVRLIILGVNEDFKVEFKGA